MIPLVNPQSEYEEDFHSHNFYSEDGSHLATIEFDELEDEGSGKLFCEIAVWCRIGVISDRPLIAFERVNLLNRGAARGWLMSVVGKLNDMGSLNWEQGLDFAVNESIINYRATSSEGLWLTPLDSNADDAQEPYLLRPFIANTGTTVLYGKHGSAKSMLSVRWCLSVATGKEFDGNKPTRTGPVLYVDFEDTPEPHQYRLHAIGTTLGMSVEELEGLIWHERVAKNLKDARRKLRRLIRDHRMVLVVIDSIGLARASDASGSEATIKLFKMFAQLNVAVLAIDHLTKEDNKRIAVGKMDWREATPIGSQFTQSSARMTWFLNELPQSTDRAKISNLYNTKANHTAKSEPIGLTVKLDWNDKGLLTKVDFATQASQFESIVADAMKMTKAQELLVWHFRQQREEGGVIPMTYKDMERGAQMAYGTISSIVGTKHKDWWEKVKGSQQWILTPLGLELAILYADVFTTEERFEGGNG